MPTGVPTFAPYGLLDLQLFLSFPLLDRSPSLLADSDSALHVLVAAVASLSRYAAAAGLEAINASVVPNPRGTRASDLQAVAVVAVPVVLTDWGLGAGPASDDAWGWENASLAFAANLSAAAVAELNGAVASGEWEKALNASDYAFFASRAKAKRDAAAAAKAARNAINATNATVVTAGINGTNATNASLAVATASTASLSSIARDFPRNRRSVRSLVATPSVDTEAAQHDALLEAMSEVMVASSPSAAGPKAARRYVSVISYVRPSFGPTPAPTATPSPTTFDPTSLPTPGPMPLPTPRSTPAPTALRAPEAASSSLAVLLAVVAALLAVGGYGAKRYAKNYRPELHAALVHKIQRLWEQRPGSSVKHRVRPIRGSEEEGGGASSGGGSRPVTAKLELEFDDEDGGLPASVASSTSDAEKTLAVLRQLAAEGGFSDDDDDDDDDVHSKGDDDGHGPGSGCGVVAVTGLRRKKRDGNGSFSDEERDLGLVARADFGFSDLPFSPRVDAPGTFLQTPLSASRDGSERSAMVAASRRSSERYSVIFARGVGGAADPAAGAEEAFDDDEREKHAQRADERTDAAAVAREAAHRQAVGRGETAEAARQAADAAESAVLTAFDSLRAVRDGPAAPEDQAKGKEAAATEARECAYRRALATGESAVAASRAADAAEAAVARVFDGMLAARVSSGGPVTLLIRRELRSRFKAKEAIQARAMAFQRALVAGESVDAAQVAAAVAAAAVFQSFDNMVAAVNGHGEDSVSVAKAAVVMQARNDACQRALDAGQSKHAAAAAAAVAKTAVVEAFESMVVCANAAAEARDDAYRRAIGSGESVIAASQAAEVAEVAVLQRTTSSSSSSSSAIAARAAPPVGSHNYYDSREAPAASPAASAAADLMATTTAVDSVASGSLAATASGTAAASRPKPRREERRYADDGEAYTKDEFVSFFGGTAEWNFAAPEEDPVENDTAAQAAVPLTASEVERLPSTHHENDMKDADLAVLAPDDDVLHNGGGGGGGGDIGVGKQAGREVNEDKNAGGHERRGSGVSSEFDRWEHGEAKTVDGHRWGSFASADGSASVGASGSGHFQFNGRVVPEGTLLFPSALPAGALLFPSPSGAAVPAVSGPRGLWTPRSGGVRAALGLAKREESSTGERAGGAGQPRCDAGEAMRSPGAGVDGPGGGLLVCAGKGAAAGKNGGTAGKSDNQSDGKSDRKSNDKSDGKSDGAEGSDGLSSPAKKRELKKGGKLKKGVKPMPPTTPPPGKPPGKAADKTPGKDAESKEVATDSRPLADGAVPGAAGARKPSVPKQAVRRKTKGNKGKGKKGSSTNADEADERDVGAEDGDEKDAGSSSDDSDDKARADRSGDGIVDGGGEDNGDDDDDDNDSSDNSSDDGDNATVGSTGGSRLAQRVAKQQAMARARKGRMSGVTGDGGGGEVNSTFFASVDAALGAKKGSKKKSAKVKSPCAEPKGSGENAKVLLSAAAARDDVRVQETPSDFPVEVSAAGGGSDHSGDIRGSSSLGQGPSEEGAAGSPQGMRDEVLSRATWITGGVGARAAKESGDDDKDDLYDFGHVTNAQPHASAAAAAATSTSASALATATAAVAAVAQPSAAPSSGDAELDALLSGIEALHDARVEEQHASPLLPSSPSSPFAKGFISSARSAPDVQAMARPAVVMVAGRGQSCGLDAAASIPSLGGSGPVFMRVAGSEGAKGCCGGNDDNDDAGADSLAATIMDGSGVSGRGAQSSPQSPLIPCLTDGRQSPVASGGDGGSREVGSSFIKKEGKKLAKAQAKAQAKEDAKKAKAQAKAEAKARLKAMKPPTNAPPSILALAEAKDEAAAAVERAEVGNSFTRRASVAGSFDAKATEDGGTGGNSSSSSSSSSTAAASPVSPARAIETLADQTHGSPGLDGGGAEVGSSFTRTGADKLAGRYAKLRQAALAVGGLKVAEARGRGAAGFGGEALDFDDFDGNEDDAARGQASAAQAEAEAAQEVAVAMARAEKEAAARASAAASAASAAAAAAQEAERAAGLAAWPAMEAVLAGPFFLGDAKGAFRDMDGAGLNAGVRSGLRSAGTGQRRGSTGLGLVEKADFVAWALARCGPATATASQAAAPAVISEADAEALWAFVVRAAEGPAVLASGASGGGGPGWEESDAPSSTVDAAVLTAAGWALALARRGTALLAPVAEAKSVGGDDDGDDGDGEENDDVDDNGQGGGGNGSVKKPVQGGKKQAKAGGKPKSKAKGKPRAKMGGKPKARPKAKGGGAAAETAPVAEEALAEAPLRRAANATGAAVKSAWD